ncbi:MAG: hypothetical protein FWF53_01580 [Candidatus Azobacteroides sp.]|nr:hypothetical protein [Candidatus Azobacteroides sp.]
MQNKKNLIGLSVLGLTAAFFILPMNAQVTVGSLEPPKATLDVVAGESGNTTAPGIIAPRLTLAELNAKKDLYGDAQKGAVVYITDASDATFIAGYSDEIACEGFAYWNGTKWVGNCVAARTFAAVTTQPQAFTFYEKGTETIVPLVFGAGGSSAMTYQWYKITGSNIHVRIAVPCTDADGTGFNTASFTPTSVIKGRTSNANNCGFYKYYCVAKNQTNDSIVSNIAEVAVGCGAKDMNGEWLSFMCFNLGGTPMNTTMQKAVTINHPDYNPTDGQYSRFVIEDDLYGDLYQWGRIGDGHEKRYSESVVYNAATPPTLENGNFIGEYYPYSQVSRSDATYYGKFIRVFENANNWYPAYSTNIANIADRLWNPGRYKPNDPCAKVRANVISYETWYPSEGDPLSADTGWRTPEQGEWGSIYRGGAISGSPSNAMANTWSWYDKGDPSLTNGVKGYEIKPDGVTTTLFLIASGYRPWWDGDLHDAGNAGHYWSTTTSSSNAMGFSFDSNIIYPAYSRERALGFSLRCIKN